MFKNPKNRHTGEQELLIYKELAELLPQTIFEVSLDGSLTFGNKSGLKIFGYTLEDFEKGLNVINLIVPSERQRAIEDIQSVIRGTKKSHGSEYTGLRKDNTTFSFSIYSSPIIKNNSPIGLRGIIIDITDKKTIERELRESEHRFRDLAEKSLVGIYLIQQGKFMYVNSRFAEVFGYCQDEMIGTLGTEDLVCEESLSLVTEKINRRLANKSSSEHYCFKGKTKDGKIIDVEVYGSRTTIKGEPAIIGSLIEITQRKIAEEQAQALNRLKSSFLANMNHELRTPLIGILGFADILHYELSDPDQKEMAKTIFQSGQRLLECLNMILDLSRVESDRLELEFKALNLATSISQLAASFRPLLQKKNLDFSIVIKDKDPVSRVDEKIFIQVIKNLLNNAIKFTSTGGITVEISTEFSSAGVINIIKVIDTGIGIGKDEQKIIFEEFRQAQEGFNRPYEGTGLGLTITKKFVELMGGKISLQSEVGRGSIFIVKFPSIKHITKVEYNEPEAIQKEFEFNKPVILLVENDPSSIKIIRYFLKGLCRIENAQTGEEAIKLVKINRYNAVLMDIDLGSGINGLETVKEIKTYPNCKNIPIVAVTAYAMHSDKEKFLRGGCTHYLSKPFDKRSLVDLISHLIQN